VPLSCRHNRPSAIARSIPPGTAHHLAISTILRAANALRMEGVFNFVLPIRADRDGVGFGGKAEFEGHASNIDIRGSFASGGMAARYRSGYLISRRRGALSHAEALATGETPSPRQSTSQNVPQRRLAASKKARTDSGRYSNST
jgi:hypothetical protein